jgi:N-glycosidase YbiA
VLHELRAVIWPTSEHYFQGNKFADQEYAEKIRRAWTPSLAARMGRSRAVPLRPDWAGIRVEVIRRAMRAKFTQHPALTAKLAATGDCALVEDTQGDFFWDLEQTAAG